MAALRSAELGMYLQMLRTGPFEASGTTPDARRYSFGATYSFGFADPSPKKNISNCFTMTS